MSNKQRMLRFMGDLEWHRGAYLADRFGWRFGGIIGELRDDGYSVQTRLYSTETGECEYRLVSRMHGAVRSPSVQVRIPLEWASALVAYLHTLYPIYSALGAFPWVGPILAELEPAIKRTKQRTKKRLNKEEKR